MRTPTEAALRADPDLTAHTAGELATTAEVLDTATRPLLAGLPVPRAAYGGTPAAGRLARAHEQATADAEAAVTRFARALLDDADRLYQAALGFRSADSAAVDRTGVGGVGAGGGGGGGGRSVDGAGHAQP